MTTDPQPTTAWMNMTSASEVADGILELYLDKGSSRYDEAVSQTEHALQSAELAAAAGAPDATVVAAFLHDIGHLLVDEHAGQGDFLDRDLHHEDVGGRFLANWFPAAVTEPIRHHVTAKRYLCAVDAAYHDGLSESSVRSLIVQGGPMNSTEIAEFDELDGGAVALDVRRWDDLAKVTGVATRTLDDMKELLVAQIEMPTS